MNVRANGTATPLFTIGGDLLIAQNMALNSHPLRTSGAAARKGGLPLRRAAGVMEHMKADITV
jgi:hypothetical protein